MLADNTADTISGQFAAGSDGCGGKGEGTPLPVSPGGEAGGTPAASCPADNDTPLPPHRVLVKVGEDYYPARVSLMLNAMPDWRSEPEFARLVASAERDQRFQQAVLGKLVTDTATGCLVFEIEDGRHRFWAAEIAMLHNIQGALTEMPVAELMLRSLLERRHLEKGARAYLAWPIIAPEVEANKDRRKSNLIAGAKQKKEKGESLETKQVSFRENLSLAELSSDQIPEAALNSLMKLAEDYGISHTLLQQARRVHAVFDRRKDLKAQYEPDILTGEKGMGGILAGWAGQAATENKPRNPDRPELLYCKPLQVLRMRFEPARWQGLAPEMQQQVEHEFVETALAVPESLRARLILALK